MPGMKRLIASDEQGRGLLGVERGTQPNERLLGPVLRRAFGADPKVHALGCNEHPIGVLEASRIDAVDPDREGVAEGGAGLRGWTDEIRDDRAARLDHPVAYPSHAARVLDPVRMNEAQVARKVRAHRVGIEPTALSSGASAFFRPVSPRSASQAVRLASHAVDSSHTNTALTAPSQKK